ncbi:MAG: ABC transporter substrate-binding protein [Promethearchaeota archaeon]
MDTYPRYKETGSSFSFLNWRFFCSALIIALLVFWVFGSITLPPPNGRTPWDQFVFETAGDPDSMDPHVESESLGTTLLFNIYETLYTYPWESETTEATVPLLAATAPAISADGLRYNISLREDITFHDETPFNASCVKWNIERALRISYNLGLSWLLAEVLKGASALGETAKIDGTSSAAFRNAFDSWVNNSGSIEVLDTYTIQLVLEDPFSPFLQILALPVCSMISPSYALGNPNSDPGPMDSHWGVDYGEVHTWMENHTCGTGPYTLDEWRPNEFMRMNLVDGYWRADAEEAAIRPPDYDPPITDVFYKTNEDTEDRMSMLRRGYADSVDWPTANADEIWDNVTLGSKDEDLDIITGGYRYSLTALAFNFNPTNITRGGVQKEVQSPFIYRDFRKCLAYAFDYETAIGRILGGWGVQAEGFSPQGMFGHDPSHWAEEYSVLAASTYWNFAMQNSSFVIDINAMEGYIDLYFSPANSIEYQACLLVKEGLESVMAHPGTDLSGISPVPEVRINPVGLDDYQRMKDNSEFPMWLIERTADYADPHNFAFPLVHSQGSLTEDTGYNNSQVDQWVFDAVMTTNRTEKLELYGMIQAQVADDQPCIYMYQPTQFEVRQNHMRGIGLEWNPMHGYYWYHIWKDYFYY